MMSSRVFFRSMATATKSVKPPVQLFGVDGTYASALFSASSSIEATNSSLVSIADLIKQDPKINDYLSDPSLSLGARKTIVEVLNSKLSLDKSVSNFLTVLAENNRLANFSAIFEQFGILNEAHNGIVEATVTSATPLDSKILKRLQASISKSPLIGEAKTLKVTNKVNPEILGGLVVEVADRTVDLSVSGKVSKLNKALTDAL